MSSEGCTAHPTRYNSLLQIKMAIWCTFFEFDMLGRVWEQTIMAVWRALNFKKVRQIAITICSGLLHSAHPTRSFSRIVCKGQ
jgi:hypothetical protein